MGYDNRNNLGRSGGKFNQTGSDYKKGQLPQGYLAGGYFETVNGEEVLKKDYIVKYSKEIADALSNKQEWDSGKEQNKRSQIRKYYEYCLRIQGSMQRKNGDFAAVESELNRLLPFIEYARSRSTVSELFRVFINKNISQIHEAKELNAFIKHFEAIVAYLPKEKN